MRPILLDCTNVPDARAGLPTRETVYDSALTTCFGRSLPALELPDIKEIPSAFAAKDGRKWIRWRFPYVFVAFAIGHDNRA